MTDQDNEPRGVEVGVVEAREMPGVWVVEAIDTGSEGEIYEALFTGPKAKDRALAYALWAYGHTPNPIIDGLRAAAAGQFTVQVRPRPLLTLVPNPKEPA